ncbi:hypothetical protein [Cohnella nanjingensis]|uniref:Uncharacterized protein n=1 Tax=Cohnella nanjingensis TaxID=1387779 RepID=A0A7X0VGP7_9BACL|nr:hypothetical protein [Cohnella nanjingensis]MBB6672593.1 hypothetical protein [Cohnella nanjingensis]
MTNAAAIGYMILAAKKLDWSIHDIHTLESMMVDMMDERTEEEAEEIYRNT